MQSSVQYRTNFRRGLFILYLACIELPHSLVDRFLSDWSLAQNFLLGASWPQCFLALWLTTRVGVWTSTSSICRLIAYFFAYLTGCNLSAALFESQISFPDWFLLSDMVILLLQPILLFLPIVMITNSAAYQVGEEYRRNTSFSIIGLLGATSFAAFYIVYFQTYHAVLNTSYIHPILDALPFWSPVLATFVVFFGFTQKLSIKVMSFIVALAITVLGNQISMNFTASWFQSFEFLVECFGHLTFVVIALVTANALGIRFRIGAEGSTHLSKEKVFSIGATH